MKKILIFSPPFGGHLTILNEFINKYADTYDIKLVITGWKNISPDNISKKCHPIILSKSKLEETDPALWTFKRVSELLPSCLKIAREYKPDLIFYDFFSLEGVYVGRILSIPYWCSIPALIGSFTNQKYLNNKLTTKQNQESIKLIEQIHNLSINLSEIETISDGIHISGLKNIVWSYESIVPKNFKINRSKSPYHFVGNIRGKYHPKKNITQNIYFSLGTVVMNNLWNQQKETRKNLKSFILRLATLWKDKKYQIIFSSQGKKVLNQYPSNWQVYDRVDQIKTLAQADVFITHGGNNSFHEALIQQTPMLVIPFFGDQLLVGQTIEDLGIGKNLVKDGNIDTKKSKSFLNDKLAFKLNEELNKMLNNPKYKQNFKKIDLSTGSLDDLLDKI